MKTTIALAIAAFGLAACSSTTQCVQPDPVGPANISDSKVNCWNMGVNCGEPISDVNAQ